MVEIIPNRVEMIRRLAPDSTGVEIGTYRGEFAAQILEALPQCQLTIVDAWTHQEGDYALDDANVNQGGQDMNERIVREIFKDFKNVAVIKSFSLEASKRFNFQSLDFVYIDANHTYNGAFGDLMAWSSKIKIGGSIFVHDYCTNVDTIRRKYAVVEAVFHFLKCNWVIVAISDEQWPTVELKRVEQ